MEKEVEKAKEAKIIEDTFRDYLGIEVVEVGEFYAVLECRVRREYLNKLGTVHGGLIAALIDLAMGVAANWDGNVRFALHISVDFLSPGYEGETLRAVARKSGGGRRVVFLEVEVRSVGDEERVVARASGIVYAGRLPKKLTAGGENGKNS